MRRRNQSGKPKEASPAAKLIFGIILCAIFVGAWQLWADTGKESAESSGEPQAQPDATEAIDISELLKVKTDSAQLPEQLVSYQGMDISFNPDAHEPNWVAWELTDKETTGTESRSNKFYSDPDVKGCAETYDYSYSGYDRGHMAPAGDMKWSAEAMNSSFSMANICPQAKSLNTGAWKRLEEKCRKWAADDGSLVIICGPVLTDDPIERIGETGVAVPRRFFKVILAPKVKPIRGIAFIMPNDKVPGGMQAAAVSIDEVERVTGHDFFASLPDDIENAVESQCDFNAWSNRR